MTLGRSLPLRGFEPSPADIPDDGDQDLSPSEGYFRDSGPLANSIFIPNPSLSQNNPSNGDKARGATGEASKSSNLVSETRSSEEYRSNLPYTPPTTYTPASSSVEDHGSVYNSSPIFTRYTDDDSMSESWPLSEEPPPQYAEAVAESSPPQASTSRKPKQYELKNVCDPVSSLQNVAFPGATQPRSMTDGTHESITVVDTDYDEESDPVAPRRPKQRGCRGRRACHPRENKKINSRTRRRSTLKWTFRVLLVLLLICLLGGMKQSKKVHAPPWTRFFLLVVFACFGVAFGLHFRTKSRLRSLSCQKPDDPNFSFPSTPNPHPQYDDFPGFMRRIVVRERSKSITGTFPLYDLLDIRTMSGSISITIDPKPGNATAELRLSTMSGAINVKIARGVGVIKRRYDTRAETTSGSVNATLMHGGGGGTTSLSTLSGSVSATIYPIGVGLEDEESTLHTRSKSGRMSVRVRSPVDGGKITSLKASHQSIGSGSLSVAYPNEWEGRVHAKSLGSGSVYVKGRGVQFERQGSRDVVGWRGKISEEARTVELSSMGSGSVQFSC